MASDAELAAMRQAIMLSALGLGTASPNPPVGCVILDRNGQVAGTGFHRRKGEPHAEVNALNIAGAAARGGTAVVTLEPCNHVGVTPACRQALLDAGIIRVIVGHMDPTSRGDGGAAVLTAAGVDVESGVLSDEVLTVLRPWLTATIRRAPYVTLAYAVGTANEEQADACLLHHLRSTVDVIVTNTHLEEGRAGGHADRHFQLTDLRPPEDQLDAWLPVAYNVGVRTVLMLGRSHVAESFLAADAVDHLILAVSSLDRHFDPSAYTSATSSSFEIVDLSRLQLSSWLDMPENSSSPAATRGHPR